MNLIVRDLQEDVGLVEFLHARDFCFRQEPAAEREKIVRVLCQNEVEDLRRGPELAPSQSGHALGQRVLLVEIRIVVGDAAVRAPVELRVRVDDERAAAGRTKMF